MKCSPLRATFQFLATLTCLSTFAVAAGHEPVSITLLHTNDLHSHFRSDKTPLKLGGLSRMRTRLLELRAQNPDSLLVDAGDWSEGQVYYVEGAGAESLKMMDWLGFDVAVVGNHDWLNGPGQLLNAIHAARPHLTVVGANFEMNGYDRAKEFHSEIAAYSLKEVHGIKIAFIGLVCIDPVYGSYLAPVTTVDAAPVAEKLAASLKLQHLADVVVGISHNTIGTNREILQAAPSLDLIVGGHDHQRLVHPVVVPRAGHADAWIVEAGKWGQYVGQLNLRVTPASATEPAHLDLRDYHLNQIDRNVAEDAETLARVDALEARIETKMGPIFHDHVVENDIEVSSDGLETVIGDLVTDAYHNKTGADVTIDQNRLIYGELHTGDLTSADFFNAMPPIYNPETGKGWTLQTWKMSGANASLLFRMLYTWRKIAASGGLSISGLEIMYDPSKQKDTLGIADFFGTFFAAGNPAISELTIHGRPIDSGATYTFAASSGIVKALQGFNEKYHNFIILRDLKDSGLEDWRVVRDYAQSLKNIDSSKINYGNRIRTLQTDLGIVSDSLAWTPVHELENGSIVARVELRVKNFGGTASAATGVTVDLSSNDHGYDGTVDAAPRGLGSPRTIAPLAPGESQTFVWDEIIVPGDRGIYPLTGYIHTSGEYNTGNDGLTRYFTPAATMLSKIQTPPRAPL